jgi:hypothetical protein
MMFLRRWAIRFKTKLERRLTHEFGEQGIRKPSRLEYGVEALGDFIDPADLDEEACREFILDDDRGDEGQDAAFPRHETKHRHVVDLRADERVNARE